MSQNNKEKRPLISVNINIDTESFRQLFTSRGFKIFLIILVTCSIAVFASVTLTTINSGDPLSASTIMSNFNALNSALKWNSSGSNIYYNDGNVGIGTTSPGQKLEVNGSIKMTSSDSYFGMGIGTSDTTGLYFPAVNTLAFLTSATERIRITSTGNVGIGTTSPGFRLQVGDTSNYGWVAENGSWSSSSDIRFKENVKYIDSENCLEKISLINGIRYNVKGDKAEQIGFSAQDMEKIIPEVVSTDKNGYKGIVYGNITPVLVEAIKELKSQKDAEIARLTTENEELKSEIKLIKEKLGMK